MANKSVMGPTEKCEFHISLTPTPINNHDVVVKKITSMVIKGDYEKCVKKSPSEGVTWYEVQTFPHFTYRKYSLTSYRHHQN